MTREQFPPTEYRCKCGRSGVKLYRMAHFAPRVLLCADCVCSREGIDPASVDDSGRVPYHAADPQGVRTDQIGSWMPAVPVAGDKFGTFWGYCAVPPEWAAWWYALPLRAAPEVQP